MKCLDRFLKYVKIDTTSNPNSNTNPSSMMQIDFAKVLKKDMEEIGIQNIVLTEKGYLYGCIPSNTDKILPNIGFIAHMDTSCDCKGSDINPIIHANYDGNDVKLNDNTIMLVNEYPFLKDCIGKTLITTDGNTLLGADDKAGIVEILCMAEYIINNNIPHGNIKIAFTPDEEIGAGADFFDVELFDCEYAYTVDGSDIFEVEYENFNAASCDVCINGFNIHPGAAKDKMINSIYIANEFDRLLPENERPEKTTGYEGFNHLNNICGSVEQTKMHYIVRNHDMNKFLEQKQKFIDIQNILNAKYGNNTVVVEIKDSYYNMKDLLLDKMYIVERAMDAIRENGFNPVTVPIRGGTDGARLTFMNLPTPNLGTGGHNFHGKYECICLEDMESMVKILVTIVCDLYNGKN